MDSPSANAQRAHAVGVQVVEVTVCGPPDAAGNINPAPIGMIGLIPGSSYIAEDGELLVRGVT